MSSLVASGYRALSSTLEQNIFTTPRRKIAGWTAVAVTASAVGTFYLGFPGIPPEYSRNMAFTCGKHIFTTLEKLPDSLQFVNATDILRRLPETENSCVVSLGAYFGRMCISSITSVTIPIISWRHVFQILSPKEKLA